MHIGIRGDNKYIAGPDFGMLVRNFEYLYCIWHMGDMEKASWHYFWSARAS